MAGKINVHIDVELIAKLRAKAIGDGLPNARSLPDAELLAALIRAELGESEPVVEPPPEITPVEGTVWVKSEAGLNLRTQPVTGQVLKTLPDREELSLVGRQGDWLRVRTADGLRGWVSAEFVTDEEPVVEGPVEVTSQPSTVWVKSSAGLNLRAQPVSGDVIKALADKQKLTLLGRREDWVRVRTTDGLTGWVSVEFVTDTSPHPPIPSKGNVRGIHGSAGVVAPPRHLWDAWISQLKGMGTAWYKQLDAGDPNDDGPDSTFAWTRRLKRNGIEPIIRYYQGQMFPGRLSDSCFEKMGRYANEGIVWSEIGNEPNLDEAEWHSDHHGKVSWQEPFYPHIIVENWINDAERAVVAGARPGFYALAPTDWGAGRPHPRLSSVMFYQRMFEHVAGNPDLKARFRRLFEPGKAWLAVHVSIYELQPEFNPFPPGEPPYDMCLRGYEIPLRFMRQLLLGDAHVTVMSTEGGVFTKDSTSMGDRPRLASHEEHAQRTVEMFDWIQKHSPLQAMCPWLICNVRESIGHHDSLWEHDGWYDGGPPDFAPKPVVQAMKNSKPAF